MRAACALLACLFAVTAYAANEVSLADTAQRAVQESKLTLPGSKPFHLKAKIVETTNPKSEYQGSVEEYWVSPQKWMRTIESPGFSQKIIVNGDKTSETNTGDYFPWWLNDLVTAMFDPLPRLETLPWGEAEQQEPLPLGPANVEWCVDGRTPDHWRVCFQTGSLLLSYVGITGYDAAFHDYKRFGGKQVARRIVIDPEPGTEVEAKIVLLEELTSPDEKLFTVDTPTPPEQQISRVQLKGDVLRSLVKGSSDVAWPEVGGGLTKGLCAVYLSADRAGHVREVWPGGCDNPGLQDPLRDAIKNWQLQPSNVNGVPVQVEGLVGFRFETKVATGGDPTPVLSDAQARALATYVIEPHFPFGSLEKGTAVEVRVSVDETGKVAGVGNTQKLNTDVFLAIYEALEQWRFRPYMKDGKPQYFHAHITFQVP